MRSLGWKDGTLERMRRFLLGRRWTVGSVRVWAGWWRRVGPLETGGLGSIQLRGT